MNVARSKMRLEKRRDEPDGPISFYVFLIQSNVDFVPRAVMSAICQERKSHFFG